MNTDRNNLKKDILSFSVNSTSARPASQDGDISSLARRRQQDVSGSGRRRPLHDRHHLTALVPTVAVQMFPVWSDHQEICPRRREHVFYSHDHRTAPRVLDVPLRGGDATDEAVSLWARRGLQTMCVEWRRRVSNTDHVCRRVSLRGRRLQSRDYTHPKDVQEMANLRNQH